MNSADSQQRGDARALLPIAIREREEYVKLYTRLQNNVTQFVDRSNHELAALALAIQQKTENIVTLQKMVDGYFVAPTPPVTATAAEKTSEVADVAPRAADHGAVNSSSPGGGSEEPGNSPPPASPKRRANGVPPVVVTKKVDDAKESPKP